MKHTFSRKRLVYWVSLIYFLFFCTKMRLLTGSTEIISHILINRNCWKALAACSAQCKDTVHYDPCFGSSQQACCCCRRVQWVMVGDISNKCKHMWSCLPMVSTMVNTFMCLCALNKTFCQLLEQIFCTDIDKCQTKVVTFLVCSLIVRLNYWMNCCCHCICSSLIAVHEYKVSLHCIIWSAV
jgi:hypothetical protein